MLRFVNAGHNPPALVCDGEIRRLESTGKPIGILPDSAFAADEIELPHGCTLFLYTDGLNEAANLEEEEFGNERLNAAFASAASLPTEAIHSAVFEELTRFENGAPATDDKTLVVLRRS
jgi:sigma-B regulation protein RsbU (phosphoserine phosphatase)